MAFEVVMPRLGWNMEVGALAGWRKRDGDSVQVGEILFEVESDKAVQEVESLESGILHIPPDSPPLGQPVPVGTLLAYLVGPGEQVSFQAMPAAATLTPASAQAVAVSAKLPASADRAETPQPLGSPHTWEVHTPGKSQVHGAWGNVSGKEHPAISPRAARVASELGVDWTRLKGSGRTGRIVERDVRQAAAAQVASVEVRASPVARRVAQELQVDLTQLAAQMPGRRIERADVEAAVKQAAHVAAAPTVPAPVSPMPTGAARSVPITQVRRMTAERMATSAHTTAPVTLTTEVDATELVRLRNQLKGDGAQVVPSYNDLLGKLVAQALMEYPQVNAHFEGDSIVQSATVNMGIAVDTERGLLVPVVRDAQAKSLRQIAQESAVLIERAKSGRISPDELTGGTFTITNLGMFEIDAFTPIINLPECAILGVGRIVPKQVVVDADMEHVAIRHMMFLSLTFDHRLVDGAQAARFLQRVKQYVERPYLWLVN